MESNYPFTTGRSNLLGTETFRNLLGTSLNNAKKSVIILSAYVTEKGMKWAQEQITNNNVNCTIIVRWDKNDLAQGSSDLNSYELAKNRNWKFKILKDLHAKVMLVDHKDLFIGSPNLTGHGMNLVPVSNKEIGVNLEATKNDIDIILNLVNQAIEVDQDLFDEMKKWKKELPIINKQLYPDFPESIKEKLKENFDKLWVHNFPWCSPEQLLNLREENKNINHDLELFGLTKRNINEENLKQAFESSKIFLWLLNYLKKTKNREIYFGNLSLVIHQSLLDDPRPYRKEIKDLQINLYSFLKRFNFKKIIIDKPNISERIILKD
jgi:hypothetical protein